MFLDQFRFCLICCMWLNPAHPPLFVSCFCFYWSRKWNFPRAPFGEGTMISGYKLLSSQYWISWVPFGLSDKHITVPGYHLLNCGQNTITSLLMKGSLFFWQVLRGWTRVGTAARRFSNNSCCFWFSTAPLLSKRETRLSNPVFLFKNRIFSSISKQIDNMLNLVLY